MAAETGDLHYGRGTGQSGLYWTAPSRNRVFHSPITNESFDYKHSEEEQHARDKLHLEMSWGMGRPETLDNSKEKKATTFEKDQDRCGAHVTSGLYRLCFRLADSSASKSSGR